MRFQSAAAFILVFMLAGCVTNVPVEEYSIARAAYDSAKDADSSRYASALWYNAESAYREAQRAYNERRYSAAKAKFEEAKSFAEQAENAARLARRDSGETP